MLNVDNFDRLSGSLNHVKSKHSGALKKWFIQIKVAGDLPVNQYFKFLLAMVDTLAQELKLVIA